MIDIIISDNCEHCEKQIANMSQFAKHEFRIIKVGSEDFENLAEKGIVDAVPFIIVRDDTGIAKYAACGVHEETELKDIQNKEPVPAFNLRHHREVKVSQKLRHG